MYLRRPSPLSRPPIDLGRDGGVESQGFGLSRSADSERKWGQGSGSAVASLSLRQSTTLL